MSAAPSILIVDDDPRLCRALARYFEREGYSVRTATSGAEMRQKLALERPDLVLLDLMLPDEDGFSLARELRANSDIAVVILTGKADTVDKVVGLELGADDYVTKPFDERELLARVRSVLRRASTGRAGTTDADGTVARFAGWTLDLGSYELTSPAGEPVSLTSHEFQLLAAFARHPNRVLTRDAIMDLIAGRNWSPEDRSVDVLVGKLRKKIDDDPQHPAPDRDGARRRLQAERARQSSSSRSAAAPAVRGNARSASRPPEFAGIRNDLCSLGLPLFPAYSLQTI